MGSRGIRLLQWVLGLAIVVFAARSLARNWDELRAQPLEWSVEPGSDRPFLHPRRAATVVVGDAPAGWLGELHPSVGGQWDLDGVAGFELDFGVLAGAATGVPRYEDLTSFPAVRWDLAVTVDRDVPSSRVVDAVRASAGARLSHVDVFDVYEGPQVGEGKKSLALHLEFRAPDRTLTEEDAHGLVDKILAALRDQLGATHRG